eukprot:Tamp_21697.p1 GENE.Tamp_21697~~Tamp_21697.p1  ORF type:complete len:325 (+),score=56.62 Tamp_21697:96-977(+)
MEREMNGVTHAASNHLGGHARPVFAKASNEAIAQWVQQFRIRLKTASVRFLASKDSSVLGAQLYTQTAFDKLLQRAGAITEDMQREAATLRGGENDGDELAHQLSLLLEETVDLTTKMNSLAQVVHEIMLRKIKRLQTDQVASSVSSSDADGLGVAWIKNTLGSVNPENATLHRGGGGSLGNSLANCGADQNDDDERPGLLSLASLSGVFGEVSLGGGSAEAEHMQQLLKDIEKVIAEQRAGVDHRANGFKSSKNAGSQMRRAQQSVKHNTLFGMMSTRLESAAASFSDNAPE